MRWAGNVACVERREIHTEFWWGNERKRTVGGSRLRWEHNIKRDYK